MPKLHSNFINISTLDLTPLPGRPGVEDSTHLAAVEAAETCAERSARHALRGWFLDRTGLEQRTERIKDEIDASTAHFLPRVSMRYRVGENSDFNISLYGTGSVGLEYLRIRGTYTRVYAGYDSEDDLYELMFRRSF